MLHCHGNVNVGLHLCAEFSNHTYAVLYAHSKVYGNICGHHLRLVAIGYEYEALP